MVFFNPANPKEYLYAAAHTLTDNDTEIHAIVRKALMIIKNDRTLLDQDFISPIFEKTIQKMLQSVYVERNIIARYILCELKDYKQLFPFTIKEKAGRVLGKRYYPVSNDFEPAQLDPNDSGKTAYIATIPIVFNENREGNKAKVSRIIEALRNQTFGTSDGESRIKSSSRLGVVFGANRFRSIEKSKNRAFKDYVRTMERNPEIQMSTFGFLWEPIWEMGQKQTSISTVRHYYTLLKRLDPELADRCLASVEKPQKGINSRVPYQAIRETVKNEEPTRRTVDMFRSAERSRKIYLAIMDPDFQALNNDGFGLFTHYNRLIKLHTRRHGIAPIVASTGYRAGENVFSVLRYGVLMDMRVRAALSRLFPLAVYFPEPNFIVQVPETHSTVPESFINPSVINQESRVLIDHLLASRGIVPMKALAFGPRGAITTEMPERFVTQSVKLNFTPEQLGMLKVLKAFSGIRQSSLKSVWGWGMGMEQVISVKGPSARSKTIKLYNIFNPLKLSKHKVFDIITPRYTPSKHFESMIRFYDYYSNIMSLIAEIACNKYRTYYQIRMESRESDMELIPIIEKERFLREQAVRSILSEATTHPSFPNAKELFEIQIKHLITAFKGLFEMEVPPHEFIGLIEASKLMGREIYQTLIDIRTGRI